MRYRPGSIGFGPKDGALLEIVGTATRITHTQLFEMASLKYIENVRRVFNWRIKRLLQHAMMRKGKSPIPWLRPSVLDYQTWDCRPRKSVYTPRVGVR